MVRTVLHFVTFRHGSAEARCGVVGGRGRLVVGCDELGGLAVTVERRRSWTTRQPTPWHQDRGWRGSRSTCRDTEHPRALIAASRRHRLLLGEFVYQRQIGVQHE